MGGMDENPYESPESASEVERRQTKFPNGCLAILALLLILPVLADIIYMFATARPVTTLNMLGLAASSVAGIALVLWIGGWRIP